MSAVVRKTGMLSPIGLGAAQNAAAFAAGLDGFQASAVHDKAFAPLIMALFPEEELMPLHEDLAGLPLPPRTSRMLRLAAPALQEACEGSDGSPPLVLLAAPEPLPDRPAPADAGFLAWLSTQAELELDPESEILPTGRAGFFEGLVSALAQLAQDPAREVIVGGVDTHLDLYLLGTRDAENRIQSETVMDGFIPGEGASFIRLGAAGDGAVTLLAAHVGAEPGHRGSDAAHLGEGLASVCRDLFARALEGHRLQTVLTGLNGENFGAKEWGVLNLRCSASFEETVRVEHPASHVGDAGAALGALGFALAAEGLAGGTLAGPCLVYGSSEGPLRGAAVLS